MYKIYLKNECIAIVENPVYIKKHPTEDSYMPADGKLDATGISLPGKAYALMGKELDDLEQVVVVESDGGVEIDKVSATTTETGLEMANYCVDLDYRLLLIEWGV